MSDKIVLYCYDEEDWSFYSSEHIEEAAQNALELMDETEYQTAKAENKITLYRGVREDQTFSNFFSVKRMIADIQELASEIGGEWAEDYLEDLTQGEIDDLRDVVIGWAKKHNIDPNCFLVKDVTEVTFTFPDDWEWN